VLLVADLRTPGEALLDSLCTFEIDPDAAEPACPPTTAHA